jgi:hypothetical protein
MKIRTYVGSDGHSVWFSDDLGATWVRPNSLSGLYLEVAVRDVDITSCNVYYVN